MESTVGLFTLILHAIFIIAIITFSFGTFMCFQNSNGDAKVRIEGVKCFSVLVVVLLFYTLFLNYRNALTSPSLVESRAESSNQYASDNGLKKLSKSKRVEPQNDIAKDLTKSEISRETGADWADKSPVEKLGIMSGVVSRMKEKGCNVNFDARYYVRQLNDFFKPPETRAIKLSDAFGLIATGAGENLACAGR